jgi:hypothetical protein
MMTKKKKAIRREPPPYRSYKAFCEDLLTIENVDFMRYDDCNYSLVEGDKGKWFELDESVLKNKKRLKFFLRHDIDQDLITALDMARIESSLGIRSTFFCLLTGQRPSLWRATKSSERKMIQILKEIQSLGHEVALHYDLYGEYFQYGIKCDKTLRENLSFLRSNGIKVTGCVAHSTGRTRSMLRASKATVDRKYMNWTVWSELFGKDSLKCNGRSLKIPSCSLFDNGLKYEAYFVERNRDDRIYISDGSGKFWTCNKAKDGQVIDMKEAKGLIKSEKIRMITLLTHPHLWNKNRSSFGAGMIRNQIKSMK